MTELDNRAFITGLQGPVLSKDEQAFLEETRPFGVIIFARNVETVSQLKELTSQLRQVMENAEYPVFIDQEGGRVCRIRPPHATGLPEARRFGELYRTNPLIGSEAALLAGKILGLDLVSCGININCVPVMDIPVPGSSEVIDDRAFGTDADTVATLSRAMADGLEQVGVKPVMKHIPGHGRALVDSHTDLPVVDTPIEEMDRTDFVPFRMWARRIHFAMTAHVIYSAVDDENPATLSRRVIDNVVRRRIGFHGALMSDDISMEALDGDIGSRAERAFAAGCDLVLHCNGNIDEMMEVAAVAPEVKGAARSRTQLAMKPIKVEDLPEKETLIKRFESLMARVEAA